MQNVLQSFEGLSLTSAEESKPNTLSWGDVLLNDLVFDSLCSFLEFPDIHNLRKTSKEFAGPFERLMSTQWSLTARLNRFVKDPEGLRERLGRHNAVISGSLALQLFGRVFWPDSDMDVFMQVEAEFDAFGNYLCEEEGYELESLNSDVERHYFTKQSQMRQVATYRRKHDERAGQINKHTPCNKTVIQVIQTIRHPVEAILLGFYTTTVVNIITWNKAYSVFPECVIDRKTYLLARTPNHAVPQTGDIYAQPLSKYRNRGWDTQECVSDEDLPRVRSMQLEKTRRVGDEHTWRIIFNTNGIEKPVIPDSFIEGMEFDIKEEIEEGGLGRIARFWQYDITTPGYLQDLHEDFTRLNGPGWDED